MPSLTVQFNKRVFLFFYFHDFDVRCFGVASNKLAHRYLHTPSRGFLLVFFFSLKAVSGTYIHYKTDSENV